MERTIKEASVEGMRVKRKPTKHVLYAVKMTWSDGQVNVVSRRYSEFYDLTKKLTAAFSDVEKKSKTKVIPQLQGKGINIFGNNAMKRLDIISSFIKKLFQLPSNICQSQIVLDFFKPTHADLESSRRSTKRGKRNAAAQKKLLVKELSISGPVAFEEYYAVKDWKCDIKKGLDLKQGQVVEVIEKQESGWWFVSVEGDQGWVPKSHLDCEEENCKVITFEPGYGEIYVSTKSYQQEQQDELSFDIGVTLQIIEKNHDGWWKAIYCGREGMVPCTYLKPIGQRLNSNDKKDKRDTQKSTQRKKGKIPLTRRAKHNQSRSDMDFNTVSKLRSSAFASPEDNESISPNAEKSLSLPRNTPRRHSDFNATNGGWVPQNHVVSRSKTFSTPKSPTTVQKHFSFSGFFKSRPKQVPNREDRSDDSDDDLNTNPNAGYEENKTHASNRTLKSTMPPHKKRMAPAVPTDNKLRVPTLMVTGTHENKNSHPTMEQKLSPSSSCPDLAKLSQALTSPDESVSCKRAFSASGEQGEESMISSSCALFDKENGLDDNPDEESDDNGAFLDSPSFEQPAENADKSKNDEEILPTKPGTAKQRSFSAPLVETNLTASTKIKETRQRLRSADELDLQHVHSNSSTSSDENDLDSSMEDIVVTYEDLQNELIKSPQDDQEDENVLTHRKFSMYLAKADFKKSSDDPNIMDLYEGEKVIVLKKNPNGWWLVNDLNGRSGWAPFNYLERIPHSASDEDATQDLHENPVSPSYDSSSDDSGITSNPRKSSDDNSEIYRAIAKYNGVKEDREVDLVQNQTVRVVKKTSNGWWLVATDNEIGWTPSTYLEKVTFTSQQDDTSSCIECTHVSDLKKLQVFKDAQFEVLDEDKGFCSVVVKIPKRDCWISHRPLKREEFLPQCKTDPQQY